MKTHNKRILTWVPCLLPLCVAAQIASNDYRGLWIGQATLTHVNEVTVPLDDENNAIAPDPNNPTRTADAAHLRLIVHVNGQGDAYLLKDVAILRQTDAGETKDSDLALVSDQRLYPDFPEQEAVRIASAVFDFGDYKTTEAVNAIVDEIVSSVAASVDANVTIRTDSTTALIRNAEDEAVGTTTNADTIVEYANVEARFSDFMINALKKTTVDGIAVSGTVSDETWTNAAELATSFYHDTRATDAIHALLDVHTDTSLATDASKTEAGRYVAARYYDTDNLYQRFISGTAFGDMLTEAAQAAAAEALATTNDTHAISNKVHNLAVVINIRPDASAAEVAHYDDTAASDAVDRVLDAIVAAAAASSNTLESAVVAETEAAGWAEHATLPRFTAPLLNPTTDYNTFVQSDAFQGCVSDAAEAAAVAAVAAKKADPVFSTTNSLANTARVAARYALLSVYIQAAQARRTELPMTGDFGPGNGTTNRAIAAGTPGGLKCSIDLPASHPTNPFRHPKHPDHIRGIDITRNIRLDFSGVQGSAPVHTGAGTEKLSGIYREEIFGLHKKLGPNSNIGLKVEGSFELNRVSLIDTLNAQ